MPVASSHRTPCVARPRQKSPTWPSRAPALQDCRSQTSSLAAELIVGRSRDILYTPPKESAMFPCEEANDQSCREGAEPRRTGSARDAGAWGGRLPARRHLYGKSSLQDGWIGPWGFTREDHAARYRLGVRPVYPSEQEARGRDLCGPCRMQ